MQRWLGKVAVVTGSSGGIGAPLSKKLLDAGLTVVGIDQKNNSIRKEKFYPIEVDVRNEREISDTFKWINSNVGPVQILVNNAAILRHTNLISGEHADFKAIMDTNLLAAATCVKEALAQIKAQNLEGHIININSICGNRLLPTLNMYGASKHALTAYAELLRHEITDEGLNVRVTSIFPGLIRSAMIDEFQPKIFKNPPLMEAGDVVDAVLYTIGTPQDVQVTQLTIQPLGETR